MSGYVDHGRRHIPGGTDPIPGQAAGGGGMFPPRPSHLPVVGSFSGQRRWPGGVVLLNAYKWVGASGTIVANTNTNSLSYDEDEFPNAWRVVEDNQNVGTHTGATSIEFTVGDAGLIPGVRYNAYISWRWPAASGGFIAAAWLGPGTGGIGTTWIYAGGYSAAVDYFGMGMFGNYIGWDSIDDVITVQVGQDNSSPNSADVEVDYIVFIPTSVIPDLEGPFPPPDGGMLAQYFRNTNGNFVGPTVSFVGNLNYSAFGGSVFTDSQVVRGPLDPDFDLSFGSFGLSDPSKYSATGGSSLEYQPSNLTYPRHIYACVRLADDGWGDNDSMWTEEAFISLFANGVPVSSSPIIVASWHFVYLGLQYLDQPNSLSIALWRPPEEGTDARSPFFGYSTGQHAPHYDQQITGVSSYLDHVEWPE